jgi:hypothetical protein
VTRRGAHLLSLSLLVVGVLTVAAPAVADPCPNGTARYNDRGAFAFCVEDGDGDGSSGGDDTGTQPIGGGWTPPDDWMLSVWRSGATEEDGTPCIQRHSQWMHEDDHAAHIGMRNYGFFRWYEMQTWDGDTVDYCEDQPDDAGLPAEMVLEVIETNLPLPDPDIRPGWALTGMPAYLEVGAPAVHSTVLSGDALPVSIEFEATATYRVDWGDGHVSEHASSGGPWPEGDIVHTYADAIDRTVVVTPVWSVTASGAGQTFTFPEVELVGSELALPIREMQSVRTASGR